MHQPRRDSMMLSWRFLYQYAQSRRWQAAALGLLIVIGLFVLSDVIATLYRRIEMVPPMLIDTVLALVCPSCNDYERLVSHKSAKPAGLSPFDYTCNCWSKQDAGAGATCPTAPAPTLHVCTVATKREAEWAMGPVGRLSFLQANTARFGLELKVLLRLNR